MATFDDGSILLVSTTEGNWSGDRFGARDFAVSKLSAYGDLEWWWQVIKTAYFNLLGYTNVTAFYAEEE